MQAKLGDRGLFPDLRAAAYLNHAAISPPSTHVRQRVRAIMDDYATLGMAAHVGWLEGRERLRAKLAALIGAASGDDIGYVANTTAGITAVALCLPWQAGDAAVLIDREFPANVTPWQRAAERFGFELRFMPALTADLDVSAWLDRLDDELGKGRVRVVAVSAVQFQTGMRMPLAAIGQRCRKHDVRLFVDAIQACGVVPIAVVRDGIDYLACGSHKWLMGTEGAALLYIDPRRLAELRPMVAGWLSHDDALSFLFEGPGHLRYDRPIRRRADFVEGGMPNTIGLAALEVAVDDILSLGVARIHAHVTGYLDALEPRLSALGFESMRSADAAAQSGIASFRVPAEVEVMALHEAIDPARVSCSTPDGLLRFAPHWPNALSEVDVVVAELERALAVAKGRDRA